MKAEQLREDSFFLTRLFITFWAVFSFNVTNLGNMRKGVFSERLGNYLSLGSRVLKFKFNSCKTSWKSS